MGIDALVWKSRLHSLGYGESVDARPATGVAVVACMDARLVLERILDLRPGDAHVLRNAGGTVTDDMLRSLVVSQRLLGTREVMLVHHTDCGMTRDLSAMLEGMQREVGRLPPFPLLAFADVAVDLRASMERVRTCPFLLHRDRVRGFIFDVAGGGLTELELGA